LWDPNGEQFGRAHWQLMRELERRNVRQVWTDAPHNRHALQTGNVVDPAKYRVVIGLTAGDEEVSRLFTEHLVAKQREKHLAKHCAKVWLLMLEDVTTS